MQSSCASRALLLLLTVGLGACVGVLPLEGQGCPCTEGFTCCEASNRCIPSGATCAGALPDTPPQPEPPDGGPDAGPGDGGPGDAGPQLNAGCTEAHWCWENPTPHARYQLAVWAASPTQVWAVGSAGVATHWDGRDWTVHDSGTGEKLL